MQLGKIFYVWLIASCASSRAAHPTAYWPDATSRHHTVSVIPATQTAITGESSLQFDENTFRIPVSTPLADTSCTVDIDLVNIGTHSASQHLPYTKRLPGTRVAIHTHKSNTLESESTDCSAQAATLLRVVAKQAGLACIVHELDAGLARVPSSFAAFDATNIRRDGSLGHEDPGSLLHWSFLDDWNTSTGLARSMMLDMEWQCPPEDDVSFGSVEWLARHISLTVVAPGLVEWRELLISTASSAVQLTMSHSVPLLLQLMKRSQVWGTIRRKAAETGLHREVVYEIALRSDSFPLRKSCSLVLLQRVDAATYVDLDELRASVRHKPGVGFYGFTRHIDVERPASISSQHLLVLRWPMTGFVDLSSQQSALHGTAEFLMHMRYQSVGCEPANVRAGLKSPEWLRAMRHRYPTMLDDGSLEWPIANFSTAAAGAYDPFIAGCYAQPYLPQPVVHVECSHTPAAITAVDLHAGWTAWPDRYGFDASLTPELPLMPVGHWRDNSVVGWVTTLAALSASSLLCALAVASTRQISGGKVERT